MSATLPATSEKTQSGNENLTFSNGRFSLDVVPDAANGFLVHATDVARSLGFRDAPAMLRTVPEDEKRYTLVCRAPEQHVWYLTEPGFYRVLGQRQAERVKDADVREDVQAFQTWVFHDVLPAVRRGDSIPQPRLPMSYADALRELATTVEERDAARERAAELAPKAEASDAYASTPGDIPMGAAANALQVGRNTLFKWLRTERVLQVDSRPYQFYADWFHVALSTRTTFAGEVISYTPHVTGEGMQKLHAFLVKRGYKVRRPDVQLALVSADARHAEVPQLTR